MLDIKLLERIKKLQAKADSLKTMGPEYEKETLTFLAAVQKMLLEHDLELSDVDYQLSLTEDPVRMHAFSPEDFGLPRKKREILWEQALASTVAHAHQCEIIPIMSSNSFHLIGRREHREVAEYMFVFLYRTVVQLADKAYTQHFYELRDQGAVHEARGYRASFIEGCTTRIIRRYLDAKTSTLAELTPEQRKVALVRLSTEQGLIKALVDKLVAQGVFEDKATKPLSNRKHNADGMADGYKAGGSINLAPNVAKGATDAPAQVGAGQRQLGRGT